MLDMLLSPGGFPFAIALGLFLGLLALELLALLLGGSLFAFDMDADVDLDLDIDTDLDLDVDGGLEGASSFLTWLGLGEVPFIIWFASLLSGFGLSGLLIQSGAVAVLGAPLSPWIAAPLALIPGLLFAREVGTLVLRFMPKSETSAVARSRLGRRMGIVTQGTARPDSPAEARVRDAHGNLQYIRVIPAEGEDPIPQGSDILIMTEKNGVFHARNIGA